MSNGKKPIKSFLLSSDKRDFFFFSGLSVSSDPMPIRLKVSTVP